MLQEVIDRHFAAPKLMTRLVLRKLKESGLRLSVSEKKYIREICEQAWLNNDFSHLEQLQIKRRGRKDLSIKIGGSDVEELFHKEWKKIEATMPSLLKRVSRRLYPGYQESAEIGRLEHLYLTERFRTRLAKSYRKPFSALGLFLAACINAGQIAHDSLAQQDASKQAPKRLALLRLHHRACRVAIEIECLLHAGLSDGALARWRTLHEICVCASFISKQDEDVARRFLRHESFDRSKIERLTKKKLNPKATNEHDHLIASMKSMYGTEYVADYGWSAKALGKTRVTFRDLEDATNYGHVRLDYQKANNAVHASSLSLRYRPSLNLVTSPGDPVEWAIVTNMGLSMPADLCVWSLLNVTLAMLGTDMTADNVVTMHLLSKSKAEVVADFARVERRIWNRERALEAKRTGVGQS